MGRLGSVVTEAWGRCLFSSLETGKWTGQDLRLVYDPHHHCHLSCPRDSFPPVRLHFPASVTAGDLVLIHTILWEETFHTESTTTEN